MFDVKRWLVGESNGQPVDIFFVEGEKDPVYANRQSACQFHGHIVAIRRDKIFIDSKRVRVHQIVEDADALKVWEQVPTEVQDLYGWSEEIQKDETRRL